MKPGNGLPISSLIRYTASFSSMIFSAPIFPFICADIMSPTSIVRSTGSHDATLTRNCSILSSTASSGREGSSLFKRIDLYSPKSTSGRNGTMAENWKGSSPSKSMLGRPTASKSLSVMAFPVSSGSIESRTSFSSDSLPKYCSIILLGAFPLRNPGTLAR